MRRSDRERTGGLRSNESLNQHPLPLGVVGLSPPFIDEVYAADRPPSATTGMRRFTGS
jgi:hypothetical protein